VNAFGVYQSYYSTHLGESNSTISWIGSFQLWLQFGLGLFTGRWFDAGYCRHMIFGGTLVYVFSLFMLSITKDKFYQIFLTQGLGQGLGTGLLFVPATSVISHWFKLRRAYALGFVIAGSSLGGVIFPIMLNNLIIRVGYASAVRATGYLILGCLVISNLTIVPRLPPMKDRPVELQLPKPDIKKIMLHRPYWFALAGGFFCTWGFFLPFFYLQIYAESKGIAQHLAFYSLSILNAASIFGRVLPNFVADKIGSYNMLIPMSTATGILIYAWLAVHDAAGLIVFAILYGFFSGAFISLLPSILMTLAFNVGEIGVRVGIAYFVYSFAALTGTPIAGALLGTGEPQWWRASVFSGTCVLTGTALLCVARYLHAKDKGTWRV
jgi:MFS family permease